MSESVNVLVTVGASQTNDTDQLAARLEAKCPPGYIQRIKSLAWVATASFALNAFKLELKVGSRTLLDLDDPTGYITPHAGTPASNRAELIHMAEALMVVNDIFAAGERVYALCTTAASDAGYLLLVMERISLEELGMER